MTNCKKYVIIITENKERGTYPMRNTFFKILFATIKYFGLINIGAFIVVMIEYGFNIELLFGAIIALFVTIGYGYAQRKVETENDEN